MHTKRLALSVAPSIQEALLTHSQQCGPMVTTQDMQQTLLLMRHFHNTAYTSEWRQENVFAYKGLKTVLFEPLLAFARKCLEAYKDTDERERLSVLFMMGLIFDHEKELNAIVELSFPKFKKLGKKDMYLLEFFSEMYSHFASSLNWHRYGQKLLQVVPAQHNNHLRHFGNSPGNVDAPQIDYGTIFTVSSHTLPRLDEESIRSLKEKFKGRPLTIELDIDETLLHASCNPDAKGADRLSVDYHLRPYLDFLFEYLGSLKALFPQQVQVGIRTFGRRSHMERSMSIFKEQFPVCETLFNYVFCLDNYIESKLLSTDSPQKILFGVTFEQHAVQNGYIPLDQCIMVCLDDTRAVHLGHLDAFIRAHPFIGDPEDTFLRSFTYALHVTLQAYSISPGEIDPQQFFHEQLNAGVPS